MKSIVILIVVAIIIVCLKEIINKRLFQHSRKLMKSDIPDNERTKKQSRNLIIQLTIKSAWFHIAFFISALINGIHTVSSIILITIYIFITIFIIIWNIFKHRKYYQSFGNVEKNLVMNNTRDLQKIVNDKNKSNAKENKTFVTNYQILEKQLAVAITTALFLQVFISIALWISSL
ncbi:hypothetical protein ACHM05_06660 [Staphylococcus aureus]|uniref:hypothetical protein n=1 Tax=Staphylococcus aureus TaxID=1280 RepID=UPI0037730DB2